MYKQFYFLDVPLYYRIVFDIITSRFLCVLVPALFVGEKSARIRCSISNNPGSTVFEKEKLHIILMLPSREKLILEESLHFSYIVLCRRSGWRAKI
jgi:hypothetical protein